ncbi:MAG: DUF3108 domain-containing protein [Alphaproteobacteria bacterium]|nr:DUF3108 domain-containing protein [Alphaproteobacteria bacterium]
MKKYCLTLLFLSFFAGNAHAFKVKHDFSVFIGPFNASETSFEYAVSPKNYHVKSEVKTFGIFDTLYPFEAQYATTGNIKNNKLETTSYKYKSKSRFNRREKLLIYDDNGMPVYRVSSKNGKEKKVNIEPNINNEDTTDLQTVFAEMARQYSQVKFCDSRLEVFDGKRRFDVIFRDEGQEQLDAGEYSPFKGTAHKCSLYIDKLGSEAEDLLWEVSSDRPIYFWILEDEASKAPFIAKIEIESTPLGKLQVYTKNITVEDNE